MTPTYKNTVNSIVAVKSLRYIAVVGDKIRLVGREKEPRSVIAVSESEIELEGGITLKWNEVQLPVMLMPRKEVNE